MTKRKIELPSIDDEVKTEIVKALRGAEMLVTRTRFLIMRNCAASLLETYAHLECTLEELTKMRQDVESGVAD